MDSEEMCWSSKAMHWSGRLVVQSYEEVRRHWSLKAIMLFEDHGRSGDILETALL
jgi:hypothetical protein